jgi:cbb3-type cytochrome oxidase subunit 3
MWIFILEAGVALFLLLFIVWWTLPRKKKGNGNDE